MLDPLARRLLTGPLDAAAGGLDRAGVTAGAVTGVGFAAGAAACVAVGTGHYLLALAAWLLNRLLDGLDGPLARRRGASELGGFLDLVADFTVYAGFVIAVALDRPDARAAALVLLGAYYVSGTAFLTLSSLLERRGADLADIASDGRSLRFVGGIAEGTETVVAYILICLFAEQAAVIMWVFAVAVGITAVQRVSLGVQVLRRPPGQALENS